MKQTLLDILRGAVIGIANIIPGVSGGTMMVSMGIYDTLIHCVTHLFRQFRKSVVTLLPYIIGMALALFGLSFVITGCLENYPLPTSFVFIGLIFGGIPAIWQEMRHEKKGAAGAVLFVLFFGLIVFLQCIKTENVAVIHLDFFTVVKLLCLGALASATMVIPGVSGSMILMILGYYKPVIGALKALATAVASGQWAAVGANLGILLPFGIGVVIGIFAIAKLIEVLLKHFKGPTYCAIMGLVTASPIAIVMSAVENGAVFTLWPVLASVIAFAVGFAVAYFMSRLDQKVQKQ